MKLISVIIPVFNEEATITACLERVLAAPLPEGCEREIVIVDDCSTDETARVLKEWAAKDDRIRLFFHDRNRGKGAAVRFGLKESKGDICLIQDADLEYDPADYPRLLAPILEDEAEVVYGSRYLHGGRRRVHRFWHTLGNRMLTLASNMCTNLHLSDMETCYKVARGDLFRSIPIRSARFGLEPELTAKFARRRCRMVEVPVSYRSRGYDEGKKIGWKDGVSALFTILRFRIVNDSEQRP